MDIFRRFRSKFGTKALLSKYKHSMSVKHVLILILVAATVAGIGGTYYFHQRYITLKTNPNAEAQKQSDTLIAAVGKLIDLPSDEQPSVVTIVDTTKLSDQAFFKKALNGDVLFAYINNKEAILYRPSWNKIIQVAAINVSAPVDATVSTDTAAVASAPATQVTVAYENGSTTVGLSSTAEKLISSKLSNLKTTSITTAAKTDYVGTIVVDVSGRHASEAMEVAKLLGGTVASLPAGETVPNADLLVISGM